MFVPQGWRLDLAGIDDPVEQYETMTRVGQEAEELGFDSIWVYDHFHTVPTPEMETTFEAWTITAGLVRDTRRIHVGQMVSCNGYRSPALLAKMASTVDVMSHGRLYVGLGAGWYEHEWRAYGYRFPEIPERMGMFREACEIVYRMWTEDRPSFQGTYYAIDRPINEPKGARKPHPSFWIGGGGEKVTLRLVAKYADACNVGGTPDELRHKLNVLRQHCRDLGRDYESIVRSSGTEIFLVEDHASAERVTARVRREEPFAAYAERVIVATPDEAVSYLQAKIDAGINYPIVYLPGLAYDQAPLHLFAREVMPRLRAPAA